MIFFSALFGTDFIADVFSCVKKSRKDAFEQIISSQIIRKLNAITEIIAKSVFRHRFSIFLDALKTHYTNNIT